MSEAIYFDGYFFVVDESGEPANFSDEQILELAAWFGARHEGETVPDYPYCKWAPSDDGRMLAVQHRTGECIFRDAEDWLRYVVNEFIKPWKLGLKGTVTWQIDSLFQCGKLECEGLDVREFVGRIEYEEVE